MSEIKKRVTTNQLGFKKVNKLVNNLQKKTNALNPEIAKTKELLTRIKKRKLQEKKLNQIKQIRIKQTKR